MNETSWFFLTSGTNAIVTDQEAFTVFQIHVTENSTAHSNLKQNLKLACAAPKMQRALERCLREGDLTPELKQVVETAIRATEI